MEYLNVTSVGTGVVFLSAKCPKLTSGSLTVPLCLASVITGLPTGRSQFFPQSKYFSDICLPWRFDQTVATFITRYCKEIGQHPYLSNPYDLDPLDYLLPLIGYFQEDFSAGTSMVLT